MCGGLSHRRSHFLRAAAAAASSALALRSRSARSAPARPPAHRPTHSHSGSLGVLHRAVLGLAGCAAAGSAGRADVSARGRRRLLINQRSPRLVLRTVRSVVPTHPARPAPLAQSLALRLRGGARGRGSEGKQPRNFHLGLCSSEGGKFPGASLPDTSFQKPPPARVSMILPSAQHESITDEFTGILSSWRSLENG